MLIVSQVKEFGDCPEEVEAVEVEAEDIVELDEDVVRLEVDDVEVNAIENEDELEVVDDVDELEATETKLVGTSCRTSS